MITPAPSVRRLGALDAAQLGQLADVLIDCVEGGASVSFMQPLTRERALAFWRRVAQGVEAGECAKTLLVLDAVTDGDAARLYERLGWEFVGVIPGYALFPQGGLCATTYYYRNLGA